MLGDWRTKQHSFSIHEQLFPPGIPTNMLFFLLPILLTWPPPSAAQLSEKIDDDFHLAYKLMYFAADGEKNMVLSPYGIQLSLYMLYRAIESNDNTAKRIAHHGFGVIPPENTTMIMDLFYSLKTLPSVVTARSTKLKILAMLAIDGPRRLSGTYMRKIGNFFADQIVQPVINANFEMEGDRIAARINKQASNLTRGMIDELIEPGLLNSQTPLSMINAIYLSAGWHSDIRFTKSAPNYNFQNIRGGATSVSMVSGDMSVPYYEDERVQVVRLPLYHSARGYRLGVYFILPKLGRLMQDVVKDGILDRIPDFKNMNTTSVNVTIPEFEIDNSYNVLGDLRKIAVYNAFNENLEVSPLNALLAQYDKNLFVNGIEQKASIKVNRRGIVKAAGPRSTMFATSSSSLKATKIFLANRPFVFYVTARNRGTFRLHEHFLFGGQYTGIDN